MSLYVEMKIKMNEEKIKKFLELVDSITDEHFTHNLILHQVE